MMMIHSIMKINLGLFWTLHQSPDGIRRSKGPQSLATVLTLPGAEQVVVQMRCRELAKE